MQHRPASLSESKRRRHIPRDDRYERIRFLRRVSRRKRKVHAGKRFADPDFGGIVEYRKRNLRFHAVSAFKQPGHEGFQPDRSKALPLPLAERRQVRAGKRIAHKRQRIDPPERECKQKIVRFVKLLLRIVSGKVVAFLRRDAEHVVQHKSGPGFSDAEVGVRVDVNDRERLIEPSRIHPFFPERKRAVMRFGDAARNRMRGIESETVFQKRHDLPLRPRTCAARRRPLSLRRKRTAVIEKEIQIKIQNPHAGILPSFRAKNKFFLLRKRLIGLKNNTFLSHLHVKIFKTVKNPARNILRL